MVDLCEDCGLPLKHPDPEQRCWGSDAIAPRCMTTTINRLRRELAEVESYRRGLEQTRLLEGLPLPPRIVQEIARLRSDLASARSGGGGHVFEGGTPEARRDARLRNEIFNCVEQHPTKPKIATWHYAKALQLISDYRAELTSANERAVAAADESLRLAGLLEVERGRVGLTAAGNAALAWVVDRQEQSEIAARAAGAFNAAVCHQQFAEWFRCGTPIRAIRGTGWTTLVVHVSDGLVMSEGDALNDEDALLDIQWAIREELFRCQRSLPHRPWHGRCAECWAQEQLDMKLVREAKARGEELRDPYGDDSAAEESR